MTKAFGTRICVAIVAGAIGGCLIGLAIPLVIEWLPMSSPIRKGLDTCVVGVEKGIYQLVKWMLPGTPADYGMVFVMIGLALIGACVGFLIFRYKRQMKRNQMQRLLSIAEQII